MDLTKIMIDKETSELRDAANTIARMYLHKFPREKSYGIELESGNILSIPCASFSDDEIAILRKCAVMVENRSPFTIIDALYKESHKDLVKMIYKLAHIDFYSSHTRIKTIHFDDQKFTDFTVKEYRPDGTLGEECHYNVQLTDDEYKFILAELIYYRNLCSMNMLVYLEPRLGSKIMDYLTHASWSEEHEELFSWLITGENPNPFIIEMSELKTVCNEILNPFIDKLKLFSSDDESLKNIVIKQQIIPGCKNYSEFYHSFELNYRYSYHASVKFEGKDLMFLDEAMQDGDFVGLDRFKVDVGDVMCRFSLAKPCEILQYLKDHYKGKECLQQVRKDLQGLDFKDDWGKIPFEERLREVNEATQRKMDECMAEAELKRNDTDFQDPDVDFDIEEWCVPADEALKSLREKYGLDS